MTQYTLTIMNKSFKGTIFLNYYLDAISNIIALLIVGSIYKVLGMRKTVFYMLVITLSLLAFVLILERDSGDKQKSAEPYLIFGVKICNNVFVVGLVLACFDDGTEMFFN